MADTFLRGHLRIQADPGTIVGPNAFGELLIAKPCTHGLEGATEFWTGTREEILQLHEHRLRSMFEWRHGSAGSVNSWWHRLNGMDAFGRPR